MGDGQQLELQRIPRNAPLPLSLGQESLWFLDQLGHGSIAYNVPMAIRLQGALNRRALERSIEAIVARHEVLRSRFSSREGRPEVVIDSPGSLRLEVTNLEALPDREQRAIQEADREVSKPFDLSLDSLLRCRLLRLSESDHVLLITAHQAAFDDRSKDIFWSELMAGYLAYARGERPSLPSHPLQYVDYAESQREWVSGGAPSGAALEIQRSYWTRRLEGIEPVQLPTDRPRPTMLSGRGGVRHRELSGELVKSLETLGGGERATLFMVLLSAFFVWLHRHSGQSDIAVGSPIANRDRPQLQGLIGLFANTIVLRTQCEGRLSFRTLLREVRETVLEASIHQDLPFEQLVTDAQLARDLSRSPLVQVMFSLQDGSRICSTEPRDGALRAHPFAGEETPASRDLELLCTPAGDGLTVRAVFAADLFDGETIERWLGHFEQLLRSIVEDPEALVSELDVIPESERRELLVDWNATQAEFPREMCSHELFEAQARRTPDAVAVEFEGVELTYRELNGRANRLAHNLRAHGVGPDTPVGICVERCPEMIIGILGILKAGGAYLPLDPTYPGERLSYMLHDSGAPLVVVRNQRPRALEQSTTACIGIDALTEGRDDDPGRTATAQNLAHLIYTSGSTGRPKGVAVQHGSVVNLLTAFREGIEITESDRFLAMASMSFDASVIELFLPLSFGARLMIVPSEEVADGPSLRRRAEAFQPTVLQATPATWSILVDAGWQGSQNLRLLCGGEALPPGLASELQSRARQVWSVYGPTETTVWSTLGLLDSTKSNAASIGRPIANTQVYVLGEARELIPVGVWGELYIGGEGVARGYLGHPDLTQERFVPDPFGPNPGGRIYRTGDRVRYRPGGDLEFGGRLDHQVKLRGYRIELGEIEAVLGAQPGVSQCVVAMREDAPGDKRLVAYVTAQEGASLSPVELRVASSAHLPAYMVPSFIIELKALPLTGSGKVDRRALPAPDAMRPELARPYAEPRTSAEALLARVWSDVLALERVGVHDDFFDLGGHSLQLVLVQHRLQEAIGVEIPIIALFQNITVASLAAYLKGEKRIQRVESSDTVVALQVGNDERQPLYLLPPVGGVIFPLFNLAYRIGDDQPIYGLQDPRQFEGRYFGSIEEMAEHYADAIQRFQPAGPYFLGGWSFGGYVALEIAQQLSRRGETIGLLVLVDVEPRLDRAPNLHRSRRLLSDVARMMRIIRLAAGFLKDVRQLVAASRPGKAERPGFLRRYALDRSEIAPAVSEPENPIPIERRSYRAEWGVIRNNLKIMRAYRPKPYEQHVTLLRCKERISDELEGEADWGWGKLAKGGVEVRDISGNHLNFIREPHVGDAARTIRDCLRNAQSRIGQ